MSDYANATHARIIAPAHRLAGDIGEIKVIFDRELGWPAELLTLRMVNGEYRGRLIRIYGNCCEPCAAPPAPGAIPADGDPFAAIVGESYAGAFRSAMMLLSLIPPEVLSDAISDIDRLEGIGPLLDPTAWLDGSRFRNAKEYRDLLRAVLAVRRLLPEKEGDPHV